MFGLWDAAAADDALPAMASPPRVLVVGSTMIEHFSYVSRVPGPGETIVGERTALGLGGKGANQAVMARQLGATVTMVNCLGDDSYAEMYRRRFEGLGIDTTHVHTAAGVASGAAPIWVEADGTNRIIIVPGANNCLTAEQAVAAVDAVDASIVVGQLEIPQSVTAAAFAAAKKRGMVTVLNPAPAQTLDPALLAATDWLIPNESELALLSTGAPSDAPPTDTAILAYAAKHMHARLLVTVGAAGVALVSDDRKRVVRLKPPLPAATVVDTTGAGDAFVGAFAYGLGIQQGEMFAAALGMACATDSVTREGTQPSFPKPEKCREIFENLLKSS